MSLASCTFKVCIIIITYSGVGVGTGILFRQSSKWVNVVGIPPVGPSTYDLNMVNQASNELYAGVGVATGGCVGVTVTVAPAGGVTVGLGERTVILTR